MTSESPAVIRLQPHDDMASLSYEMDAVKDGRVALVLPWDLRFLSRQLDYDLLRREAQRNQLQVAIVSPDPDRRQIARSSGFPTFSSVEAAAAARRWNGRSPRSVTPPPSYWWEEEIDLRRPPHARSRPAWLNWLREGIRFAAFILVIVALAGTAYAIIPRAELTLVPAGETLSVTVPVSVDPEIESVQHFSDRLGGVVPTRRIGVEVEGSAEVETTGTAQVATGRAKGEALFTSRLSQDYVVPAGTIVRTSSTSYPIRFRTTADVVVPADGQARAPIEALDERTGNVGAYQINRVEGAAASAVRVTNPSATTGADPKEVRVVIQEDYDRVREHLTEQLLDQAYGELHQLLKPKEFIHYQSMRVESVPKKAYTHFIGEQSDVVGLNMRLLVSGQAVDIDSAEGIAYQGLKREMSPGYELIEVAFDVGEVAEAQDGLGWFTFFVTGRGYAAADINGDRVVQQIRGQRVPDVRRSLQEELPLSEPPHVVTWPEWPEWLAQLDRVPILPLHIDVHVTPKLEDAGTPSR